MRSRLRRRHCGVVALTLAGLIVCLAEALPAAADSDPAPGDALGTPDSCTDPSIATLAVFDCAGVDPQPSLDPADSSVADPGATAGRAPAVSAPVTGSSLPANCRLHSEVVFYAPTDWRRLARTLVGDGSPCADFYINVPGVADPKENGDKLLCRLREAQYLHSLGPQVHAMCEINLDSWGRWRKRHAKTWFDAGVLARQRMDAAGYSVVLGDLWAVNEVPSSVRRGDGTARPDLIDFLRGLYDAGGTSVPSKGLVYVIGIGQSTHITSVYKATLEGWLQDASFWSGMDSYVRFFAQEVYPDARNWGVPGAPRSDRADHFSQYLEHLATLAEAGPESVAAARDFLERTYLPLASAAWRWGAAFGYTDISDLQMEQFVSEETFAIRHYAGSHPHSAPEGRYGSAWAPNNLDGAYDPTTFARLTQGILDRQASALHQSYEQGGGSQEGACGPPGEHIWCDGDVAGAAFTELWGTFGSW